MKVIFFDIDGTLYDNINKQIPNDVKTSLKLLKEKGYINIICTGRTKYNIEVIKEIEQYIDYYIFLNGAHITDKNKLDLFIQSIDKNIVQEIILDFKNDKIVYGLQGKDTECVSRRTKRIIKLMNDCSLPIPKTQKNFYLNNDVLQMWSAMTNNKAKYYINKYPMLSFLTWGKNKRDINYDIIANNITKGEAVKKMMSLLNINKEKTISFGDSENDISMFKETNISICLGNSQRHVQEEASYVSNRIEEEGIINALKHFKLI